MFERRDRAGVVFLCNSVQLEGLRVSGQRRRTGTHGIQNGSGSVLQHAHCRLVLICSAQVPLWHE